MSAERSITNSIFMEDYFMDRSELAQFIDRLVKQKPIKAANAQEEAMKREELMSDLDHSIRLSIINRLNDEQLDEFNDLLDHDEESNEVNDPYAKFFQKAGVDLTQVVTNTLAQFARVYLGGVNAQ